MDKYNKYGWIPIPYKEAIDKISTNNKKIKQKEYISNGKYPVIDQGQDFIGGFTNDESKLLNCTLPALVFGDHTKIVKLVNYKFAPGADGVKVVVPRKFFNAKLFESFTKILALKIPDKGYARHFQYIEKSKIPLPPLPEQRAIVSKIEQLFSDLDNGIENFEKAQEQLKRYRQSVLKIACEGKLVPTEAELARADGRDYEPAGVLLARILKERREKWEVEKKRKGRKSAKYKEPAASDVSDLPGLPEGWCWTTGDAIFWFVTSGSRGWAKYYSDSGPIFLRVGNLDHDSTAIDLSNIQRVQPPAGAEGNRTCIIVGDVLISITADIGMIALVPEDIEEAYINQHVALARPVSTISPSYLAWFLSSQEGGQKQFLKLQRGATKMGLGLDDIRAVNVPLPPLPEQRRIVTELERRLSLCDKMEATIAESFEKAESLRQSILKKSFEGKLLSEKELEEVRNAPDWEPAEKLLERIKAEKKIISKEK